MAVAAISLFYIGRLIEGYRQLSGCRHAAHSKSPLEAETAQFWTGRINSREFLPDFPVFASLLGFGDRGGFLFRESCSGLYLIVTELVAACDECSTSPAQCARALCEVRAIVSNGLPSRKAWAVTAYVLWLLHPLSAGAQQFFYGLSSRFELSDSIEVPQADADTLAARTGQGFRRRSAVRRSDRSAAASDQAGARASHRRWRPPLRQRERVHMRLAALPGKRRWRVSRPGRRPGGADLQGRPSVKRGQAATTGRSILREQRGR